mmetsp:Transcript_52036/g.130677  ORF Transcript_52036/g.130677 Transcript_52036/m.130677 type:complete len:248 (+) Transcript_52036:872-1615(+)
MVWRSARDIVPPASDPLLSDQIPGVTGLDLGPIQTADVIHLGTPLSVQFLTVGTQLERGDARSTSVAPREQLEHFEWDLLHQVSDGHLVASLHATVSAHHIGVGDRTRPQRGTPPDPPTFAHIGGGNGGALRRVLGAGDLAEQGGDCVHLGEFLLTSRTLIEQDVRLSVLNSLGSHFGNIGIIAEIPLLGDRIAHISNVVPHSQTTGMTHNANKIIEHLTFLFHRLSSKEQSNVQSIQRKDHMIREF